MLTINKINVIGRKADLQKAGVHVGNVDIDALRARTAGAPRWAHFGAGNLFKAYHAVLAQRLIEAGLLDTGIIALVPNDFSSIDKLYTKNDNLFLQVVMKAGGSLEKRVVSAVTEFLAADPGAAAAWTRLKGIFANPSLQLLTVTITEKGHNLKTLDGGFLPDVAAELDAGPEGGAAIRHAMIKIAALLLERYKKGGAPLALVSTDNFSHNGDKLKEALLTVAREWRRRGAADDGFAAYLDNPAKVSFPLSMIDKITPYASAAVRDKLRESGLDGMDIVESARGAVTAPFVNTEEAEYLVIEDAFPNGRPPLEKAGVCFTTREKVDMVERMKVCTCLNPLHTSLAVFGCLLGFTSISSEMRDGDLARLAERVGRDEGMPVVTDPGIINPARFLDEVLTVRLPNPNIPDTPQRIATDTSQKLGIRFGETIKAYRKTDGLDAGSLRLIPLVIAAWCRYLLGLDDAGKTFTISPDPLLESLQKELRGVKLGDGGGGKGKLSAILSNEKIFGCDLYEAGLGARIEGYFERMLAGPGAVRALLKEVLGA